MRVRPAPAEDRKAQWVPHAGVRHPVASHYAPVVAMEVAAAGSIAANDVGYRGTLPGMIRKVTPWPMKPNTASC